MKEFEVIINKNVISYEVKEEKPKKAATKKEESKS